MVGGAQVGQTARAGGDGGSQAHVGDELEVSGGQGGREGMVLGVGRCGAATAPVRDVDQGQPHRGAHGPGGGVIFLGGPQPRTAGIVGDRIAH